MCIFIRLFGSIPDAWLLVASIPDSSFRWLLVRWLLVAKLGLHQLPSGPLNRFDTLRLLSSGTIRLKQVLLTPLSWLVLNDVWRSRRQWLYVSKAEIRSLHRISMTIFVCQFQIEICWSRNLRFLVVVVARDFWAKWLFKRLQQRVVLEDFLPTHGMHLFSRLFLNHMLFSFRILGVLNWPLSPIECPRLWRFRSHSLLCGQVSAAATLPTCYLHQKNTFVTQ